MAREGKAAGVDGIASFAVYLCAALITWGPFAEMSAYPTIFLDQRMPNFADLLPLAVVTVLFLVLGARFFLSRVGELVDEL